MPIQFVSGDLFINRYGAQALAHGCNCQDSMGIGVAKEMKAGYPLMFEENHRRCKAEHRQYNVGDVFLWKETDKPWLFNLAT